ncbi:MAG: CAP domain-containing protein [Bacteroidales bacterium]|jgi:uncharacterized protein YkwD|nr:CAP domain-containing protein [Bacteroidales bacterium]
MKLKINKKDYYSDYDVNTFYSIANLQQKITKFFANEDLLNAAVFWFTNIERRKHNLKQFQFHNKLRETAILHSEQMRNHNFFSHENTFDTRYKTLTNRIEYVQNNDFKGFMCCGENIADYPVIKANENFTVENRSGTQHLYSTNGTEIFPYSYYEFAKTVVEGWMNSPGHRKNILNPDFEYLGCGYARYEKQGNGYSIMYFKLTQNFGGSLIDNVFLPKIENIIDSISKRINKKTIKENKKIKIVKNNQNTFNPCVLNNIKIKFNALFGDWEQNKI